MAIATRIQSSLPPTITQASLATALLTAFADAGYATPIDNYTSGTDRFIVYRFDSDSTKTFGSNYLRIRITSALQIAQQISTSWNTSTKAGSNANAESTLVALSASIAIQFNSLNAGAEYKFVVITQGTIGYTLGIICPQNKPSWWDINSWSWGFIFTDTSMAAFRGSSLSPYNTTNNYPSYLNTNYGMSGINLQTNRRDILTGIILFSNTSAGVAGRTSDDLIIAAANGSGRFDILSHPESTNQYLILNNVTSGLAVRIQ